jgi:hypothetical protein
MQSLEKKSKIEGFSISIKVFCWGAGYNFLKMFKEKTSLKFELIQINAYGPHLTFLAFIRNFFMNCKTFKLAILKEQPDLLLLDSDYHFPSYLFFRKPKIYIGQAFDVLERVKRNNYKTKTIFEKLNLFTREKLDSYYQQLISTVVLVPAFTFHNQKETTFKKIPLIVREEFLLINKNSEAQGEKIGVLLSGSEIDKEVFLELKNKFQLHVITPATSGEVQLSDASTIDKFDIVLTQGGLSSISEVISRNKFLVVFPIKNHPEQMLNAIEVEQLGLGIKADIEELKDFPKLIKNINQKKKSLNRLSVDCSGAEKAAAIIEEYLTKLSGS